MKKIKSLLEINSEIAKSGVFNRVKESLKVRTHSAGKKRSCFHKLRAKHINQFPRGKAWDRLVHLEYAVLRIIRDGE